MGGIYEYEHPYLTVDCVLFRLREKLEVLLHRRCDEFGEYALPGGFVGIDQLAEDVLREKVWKKTGADGYYFEQLRTYDALDRDPRGRVVSMAYIGLTQNQEEMPGWFQVDRAGEMLTSVNNPSVKVPFQVLGFDHSQILKDALDRLGGKLWWSDLPGRLLPEIFTIRQVDDLFFELEGKRTGMLRRQLGDRVIEVGTISGTGGRPLKTYRWNFKEG